MPFNEAAYTLAKYFFIAPITSDIEKKERGRILELFKSGQISQIVSCKVLNEGFDLPIDEIAIIIGWSAQPREQIQRIGRVLRPVKGKKALIYEIISKDTLDERRSIYRNQ